MTETHTITIKEIEPVTHDVLRFVVTKPEGYDFQPGQATEVALAREGWKDNGRPFTFSSLPQDPMLEFTVKIYPERDGVTDQMAELSVGDELLIGDPWGAITYQGPGTFIAGGAGITPFIAILRDLEARGKLEGHRLLYSNDTDSDMLLAGELRRLLGDQAEFLVTEAPSEVYGEHKIDRDLLAEKVEDFDQYFYVCGPPEMVKDVVADLKELGADPERIVTEGE